MYIINDLVLFDIVCFIAYQTHWARTWGTVPTISCFIFSRMLKETLLQVPKLGSEQCSRVPNAQWT